MSTLTLQLSEKIDKQLEALAAKQGRDKSSVSLDILEKCLDLAVPIPTLSDRPYEEWRREFLEWVNSRPKTNVLIDDSRETIYEGR